MGGFVGGIVDTVTGKDAKKEAERARREQEEMLRRQEEERKREEEFTKQVEQDTAGLQQAAQLETEKNKPVTNVDFTKSKKLTDEDDEDKIKKAFRMGLRK